MKSTILKSALICGAVLVSALSMAQGGGRQGGMMMRGGGAADSSGVMLLQRADVKAELKLTDDQSSKIQSQNEGMREKMRDVFQNANGDREAMQSGMQKLMEENRKATLALLTEDQKKRLRELAIQRMGNGAAMAPDLQKELGLTEEQKTKLKDLQTKQGEANQALFEKIRNQEMSREDMQAAMKKNSETMNTEIGKILTDAQKTKLKEMGGKSFTFKDEQN